MPSPWVFPPTPTRPHQAPNRNHHHHEEEPQCSVLALCLDNDALVSTVFCSGNIVMIQTQSQVQISKFNSTNPNVWPRASTQCIHNSNMPTSGLHMQE